MKALTALFAIATLSVAAGIAQARDLGPDEALKLRDAGTIQPFDKLNAAALGQHPGGKLEETELEEEYGLLRVDDDGPGIPGERRAEVFGRGSRLDEQVTGHGLGLGIVRDIVEAWDGRLALLDSELGGLRVRIELPQSPRKL